MGKVVGRKFTPRFPLLIVSGFAQENLSSAKNAATNRQFVAAPAQTLAI